MILSPSPVSNTALAEPSPHRQIGLSIADLEAEAEAEPEKANAWG